ARRHARARVVQKMVLMTDVSGQAQPVALVVQTQGKHVQRLVFILDAGLAGALGGIEADAKAVLRSEAAADIGSDHFLTATFRAHGQPCQRLVRRTLGQKRDGAANTGAAWGGAIEEGAGATEYFDSLDELCRHILARQQAIQAVVGNVIGKEREATNDV